MVHALVTKVTFVNFVNHSLKAELITLQAEQIQELLGEYENGRRKYIQI